MSLKSKEERYQEWLERLEIPIEDTATYEQLQKYLRDELDFSDAQISALWEATGYRYEDLESIGIRPLIYVYETGPRAGQREVRYVITGVPGLWGYTAMKEWAEIIRTGE